VTFSVRYSVAFLNSLGPNSHSKPTHAFVPEPADVLAAPVAPTVATTDSYLTANPEAEQEEALTDGYAMTAASSIAKSDLHDWQRAITNLHTNVPAHAPSAAGPYQAAFAGFSTSLSPDSFNEGQRQVLLNKLKQALRHDPYDDESAYELGWLSLAGGERNEARMLFLHAIWLNPDRANAWYGWGIVGASDDQITGALATAELLTANPSQAESMHNAFPPLLLQLSSVKPDHFAQLQASARHTADLDRATVAPPVVASPASSAAASPP
jgi:tetratricopeptide (TPR) repeat protein